MALSSVVLNKVKKDTEDKKKGIKTETTTGKGGTAAKAGAAASSAKDTKKETAKETEKKTTGVSSSLQNRIARDVEYKKLGITDPAETGRKGYNRYLAEKKKEENAKKAEKDDEKWWERMGRYLGSSPDSTLIGSNMTLATEALREDTSWKEPSEEWSNSQKQNFGLLYETKGRKAAEEYAASVNDSINKAKKEEQKKATTDRATSSFGQGALDTAGAILTSPLGGADFLADLAESVARGQITERSGDLTPFEYSQAVTEGISTHLNNEYGTLDEDIPIIGGKGLGEVYGIGTSIAQSSLAAYTGGGPQALIQFFGSAAAAGVDDAKARGASDEQAIMFGITSGLAEAIPEAIGVDNLLKIGSSDTLKSLMKNIIKQSGVEGIEEGTTSIINNFADNLIMGDFSNFNILKGQYMAQGMSEEEAKKQAWIDTAEGIAFDSLAGFVSGGIHAGPQTAYQTIAENKNAKSVYGDSVTELIEEGLSTPEGTRSHELAQEYKAKIEDGKTLSGAEIRLMVEANEQQFTIDDTAKIQEAAVNRLKELGESDNVDAIATILAKQAGGEVITKAEQRTLDASTYGQRVSNELNPENIRSGGYASDWTGNIGTERINADLYNLARETTGAKATQDAPKATQTKAEAKADSSETNSQTETETAVQGEFKVSDDGKTFNLETGEDIKIADIASIKDGKMTLKLEDGTEISTDKVSFGNTGEALVYETVANLPNINAEAANVLVKNMDLSDVPAEVYARGIEEAYRFGTYNIPAAEMMADKAFARVLSEQQRTQAYQLGQSNRKAATKAKESTMSQVKKADSKAGKVHFEGNKEALNQRQKTSIKVLERIASVLGVEIYLFESPVVNGKRQGANGWYDKKDGSIHLDIYAGQNGEATILFTAAHELVHLLKDRAPAKFDILADFLMEEYGKKGVSVDELVRAQQAKARRNGRELSYDEAFEEVVADSMETMLNDGKVMEKLAKLKAKDQTLWEHIKSYIDDLVKKIKEVYAGLTPNSAEGRYVAEMKDSLERIQELFTEGLIEASENMQTIGSIDLEQFADAKNTEGEQLFQYRAMEADEDTYRSMLKKWGKFSDAQISNLFTTIDKAMDIIKDNLEILDYAWEADINDRAFSPVKPNSDSLYQVSIDFSTLCRKRLLQQTVQAQLQEALKRPMTKEEGIAIRDALMAIQEEGRQIEIACALCYVESARMKSPAQIKKFLENREAVLKDFFASKSGGDIKGKIKQAEADARERLGVGDASLKSLSNKMADQIRAAKKEAKASYKPTAEEQKFIDAAMKMTVSDFTTPAGLENLAKNYRGIFDAYTSYVRNATKSKGIENDTWWRAGDSEKIGDTLIANMNKENGLRSQSWSDFQVIHMMDYIAAVIELSTRNSKMQAYTKVPDYVELMGKTGAMINLSLIPARNYLGSLDYDSTEGMDYRKSLELRDKYHGTVGTICIGIDNNQIKQLFEDMTIDYVIPYHKSGMSAHVRKAMHLPTWSEYEKYQSESNLSDAQAKANADKYGVELLDKTDPNYHKHTSFSEWFDLKEAQQIAKMENANPSDPVKQKKYGVMYGGYMAMQNAANNYLKLCAERGLAPVFSHKNADFTGEDNYWKVLIDRKMVDNITGEVIEQKAIQPVFDEAEVLRILNDELERYPKVKEDQEYAIRRVTEKFLSGDIKGGMSSSAVAKAMQKPVDNISSTNIVEAGKEMDGVKLSDRDSDGRELSKEQAEFFKDSKVRDKKGRLMAMYHGTRGKITEFNPAYSDDKISFFFTNNREVAHSYTPTDNTLDPYSFVDEKTSIEDLAKVLETDQRYSSVRVINNKEGEKALAEFKGKGTAIIDAMEHLLEISKGTNAANSFYMHSIRDNYASFKKWIEEGVVPSFGNPLYTAGSKSQEIIKTFEEQTWNRPTDEVLDAMRDLNSLAQPLESLYDLAVAYNKDGTVEITDRFGKKSYFDKTQALKKANFLQSGGILPVYVNLVNPLIVDAKGKNWNRIEVPPEMVGATTKTELRTRDVSEFAHSHGYDGVIFKNLVDMSQVSNVRARKSTVVVAYDSAQIKSVDNKTPTTDPDIRYSLREEAPTFYSHMGKVVDGIKTEKVGAGGVIPYLKGKGVKDEEIKWSGIEAFLEGKKSLTKQELQEFIQGSMLQIGEQRSDAAGFRIVQDGADYLVKDNNGKVLQKWEASMDIWDDDDPDGDFGWSGWEYHYGDRMLMADSVEEIEHIVREDFFEDTTRWKEYKLGGGYNYREIVFTMPGSSYSNRAMRTHWGQDAEGVLAHARIQDFETDEGTMLFIEELQSDWHNEGHAKGYTTKEYEDAVANADKLYSDYKNMDLALMKYVRSNEFNSDPEDVRTKKYNWLRDKANAAQKKVRDANKVVDSLKAKGMGDTEQAPFSKTYHEFVLKRLIREAAEKGYDVIGWTPAKIQEERWSDAYAEGYRIEYDQDMPAFLKKYGKKWGAKVGKTTINNSAKAKMTYYDVNRGETFESFTEWQNTVRETLREQGANMRNVLFSHTDPFNDPFLDDEDAWIAYDKVTGTEYDKAIVKVTPGYVEVWSMPITESMKESVLTEGQPLYQDREDEGLSNRAILANALEGAAQNDIEKRHIQEYKEKIDLINSEEAHLHEVNEQIKELSFAKGPKDTRKLKELHADATRTANRISTFDKQLLRLEASKPLQDVIDRERKMAYKRAQQKGKEAVIKARQKAAETQREIITRYQESRKKAVEGREKTVVRNKIKGVVNELNQLLLHGTKDRHVMIGLQKAVAEALDAVNMDTIGAAERIAKYDALIAKANDPDVIASLTATRNRIQQQGDNLAEKIAQLKAAYGDIKNSDDPDIANGYDEVIASKIDSVVSTVGNTPLKAMSMEQLENVYDMYKMVLTRIREANRSFAMAKKENISTLAGNVMMEVEKVGGKHDKFRVGTDKIRSFMWNNTKPVYAFEHIGSKTLADVFKNVRKGEDTWAKDVTEAKEFFQKESSKYHYDRWNMDKSFSFKSKAGHNFKLTLEQIMSLYAYSKRQQADKHLELGGFVFDSNIEVVEKKKGVPVKYKVNTATAHQINKDILNEIIGKLTPEQKAFVDEMQDYLSTTMGGKGNEVSMAMYGVKLFKEKHYFPLKSAKQFMFEQNQTAGEVKVKNSGFSKETVVNASNPIILSNFMDVWGNHVNDMSMYHAFVLPLEDFNRVFSYKTPTTEGLETESVKQFIQNAYGEEANQYISQLIKDLNGGVMTDPREGIMKKLVGNWKKAAVFTSASVVIQQPSAIGRTFALLDKKYFIGGKIGAKGHKKSWEELKKYAPVAIIKEMGYFDTDMARNTIDFITAKEYKGVLSKAKAFVTDSAYRDEILSIAPAKADEVTWVAIWNAVKRETRKKNPSLKVGSEEFLTAAGERFTEVITKTQVYDSVLSRSAFMRSKSTAVGMWTSFLGEPTTSINMLEDALRQGKRGKKAYARNTIGAVLGSMLLNSVLVSFVYAARDDDEDETYLEKYLESLTKEVLEGLNPLTYLPFFKDIWSALQGFDIERADMSLISKLTTSMANAIKIYNKDTEDMTEEELAEHAKAVVSANMDIIDNISSLVGLSEKNIRRDINATINVFKTVKTDIMGRRSSFGSILDNIADGFKDSLPLGLGGSETKADKLYEAIKAGDEVYEARLRESVPDYQLRGALRGNDPRIREAARARIDGDTDTYLAIAREIIADGFSQNEVVRAINTQINAMSKEETTAEADDKLYGFFGAEDYLQAILDKDMAEAEVIKKDIIDTSMANGRDLETAEEKFYSSIYYEVQDAFEAGTISDAKAKEILYTYGDKTEQKAESTVEYWKFQNLYPDADVQQSYFEKYNEALDTFGGKSIASTGLDIKTYVDYRNEAKKCKGTDKDGDGKTDSGSVKAQKLPIINALPITKEQKDALYYAEGWAKSTLWEAPWR